MTLQEIYEMLKSITGYSSKVAYRAFPEGGAPALPFICFLETGANTYGADGIVYHQTRSISVELYTEKKSETDETLVESKLTANNIFYTKEEQYLDDEKCHFVHYRLTV